MSFTQNEFLVVDKTKTLGTVKSFNAFKGFGYIASDEGFYLLVRMNSIISEEPGAYRTLSEGDRVQFVLGRERVKGSIHYFAHDVSCIESIEEKEYKEADVLYKSQMRTLLFGIDNTSKAIGSSEPPLSPKQNDQRPLRLFGQEKAYNQNIPKIIASFLQPKPSF